MWVWMGVGCTVGIATLGSEMEVPFPVPTVGSGCPLVGAGLGSGTDLQACPGAVAWARKVAGAWAAARDEAELQQKGFGVGCLHNIKVGRCKNDSFQIVAFIHVCWQMVFSEEHACVLCPPRL